MLIYSVPSARRPRVAYAAGPVPEYLTVTFGALSPPVSGPPPLISSCIPMYALETEGSW